MNLRPYQLQAKTAIQAEWDRGVKTTLLVLPTGTGKTIVFVKVIEDEIRKGGRALILAHRGELLQQAADKLEQATGLKCAIEKAEDTAFGSWYRVTVGSVQSLTRPDRHLKFKPDHYSVIVIDEAHHSISPSYQKIIKHFDQAKILGVTATPDRGDQQNLGGVFKSLAYEYSIAKAIKEGYLSPIRALTIPLDIDLGTLKTQAGDFKLSELDDKLAPYLVSIADQMAQYCKDRKTVVFLPLIRTSQKMQEILKAKGFRVAEVNGKSKDRDQILKDFDAGEYDILCNSMLLTEGWDCPSVDCIVCLRPTKIRSLYCQIVGRGTRPLPEKDHLLLLDFLWHSEKHELCRPSNLIAESADVAKIMTKKLEEEAGTDMDLEALKDDAQVDAVHEREEALAKQLAEMKSRKRKLVDPLQFEMSLLDKDLVNYQPALGWQSEQPTAKQKTQLEQSGLFPDEIQSAGKADLLLERIRERRNSGLATPKQIRFLESRDFSHVGQWSFDAANRMIGRISSNRWRIPHGITPKTYKPKKEVNNEFGLATTL